MTRIISCLLLLLTAATGAAADLQVPTPSGWTGFDEDYRYGRESLWEYINGAAELFLDYRFRELVAADFERGEAFITVCVYDMGFPIDAFGIFEAETPADAARLNAPGAAALVQAPYRALMIKDRFYVKAEVGGGDLDDEALVAVLADVAAGLPGDDALPPELAALPSEGRLPGTVAFAGSNFLGFEDLAGCLYADYAGETGETYRLFVMRPADRFLADAGPRWSRSELGGRVLLTRTIPYEGVVALAGDADGLLGVCGVETVEAATAILSARFL